MRQILDGQERVKPIGCKSRLNILAVALCFFSILILPSSKTLAQNASPPIDSSLEGSGLYQSENLSAVDATGASAAGNSADVLAQCIKDAGDAHDRLTQQIIIATTAIVMAKKPDTLKKSPCFDVNLTKILSISNIMLTLYNVAVAIAINFVMQLINTICQAIVTEINNLLSQLCIPLPQIPGLGGLSGPAQKPCNGIPLIPMATFQPVPLPRSLSQDLFVPQSQIGPKYNTYNFNPGH